MIGNLEAVIFDMDGVLCDTDELHYQSWKAAIASFPIQFSRRDNDALRGLPRRESLEKIITGYSLTDNQKDEILLKKNIFYLNEIEQLSPKNILPGVSCLINELSQQGIKIGVASASQHVNAVLGQLGLATLIQSVCRGDQLSRTKPAPDPYLFVARMLSVSPECCLVIEDSEAGVEAGNAAGMCVLGLGPRVRLKQAFVVYPDLAGMTLNKLRAIHERWLAGGLYQRKKSRLRQTN